MISSRNLKTSSKLRLASLEQHTHNIGFGNNDNHNNNTNNIVSRKKKTLRRHHWRTQDKIFASPDGESSIRWERQLAENFSLCVLRKHLVFGAISRHDRARVAARVLCVRNRTSHYFIQTVFTVTYQRTHCTLSLTFDYMLVPH